MNGKHKTHLHVFKSAPSVQLTCWTHSLLHHCSFWSWLLDTRWITRDCHILNIKNCHFLYFVEHNLTMFTSATWSDNSSFDLKLFTYSIPNVFRLLASHDSDCHNLLLMIKETTHYSALLIRLTHQTSVHTFFTTNEVFNMKVVMYCQNIPLTSRSESAHSNPHYVKTATLDNNVALPTPLA